jgi:two-component system, NarL family, nitrate/nitrite response regulator NarL
MITVAIVDNDPYARSGLTVQVHRCGGGFDVVAACSSVEALLGTGIDVHVVLLDVVLGVGNHLAANLERLAATSMRVLAITCDPGRTEIVPALRLTPVSMVCKSDLTDATLGEALRLTAAGQLVVAPMIQARLHAAGATGPDLTPRQRAVLEIMANGVPAKTAARRLGIRYDTLHEHVQQIRERFRVAGHPIEDVITMHYKAIELGYIPDPRQSV